MESPINIYDPDEKTTLLTNTILVTLAGKFLPTFYELNIYFSE